MTGEDAYPGTSHLSRAGGDQELSVTLTKCPRQEEREGAEGNWGQRQEVHDWSSLNLPKGQKGEKNNITSGHKRVSLQSYKIHIIVQQTKRHSCQEKNKKWNSSENGMKGRVIRGRIMCKLNTDKREKASREKHGDAV